MSIYTKNEQAVITRALHIIAEKSAEKSDTILSSPQRTAEYCRMFLATQPDPEGREYFMVTYLNSQHHLIETCAEFSGTIDGAAVYPREVVKKSLQLNAAAVILFHNHPSGTCDPSSADRKITERLKDALALVDVRVLDHVIISSGSDDHYSFAEGGLI